MNELMYADIFDQPEAISQTLPELRSQLAQHQLRKRALKRLILAGSGDSLSASNSLLYAGSRYLDITVSAGASFEVEKYWHLNPSDLLAVISFSGETNGAVKAAQSGRDAGAHILAITANEESSLARIGHEVLKINFRARSRKVPHTTDFLTTLLAIATLIEHFAEKKFSILENLPKLISQHLQRLEPVCTRIGQALADSSYFYILGAGPSYGIAQYGAAKFWEAGGIRAFPFELDEIYHGPARLIDPGDPVFFILPERASLKQGSKILSGYRKVGVCPVVVTNQLDLFPDVEVIPIESFEEEWSPFLTCLPLQLLCWAIATAKGYDVVLKNGRQPNPEIYQGLFEALTGN